MALMRGKKHSALVKAKITVEKYMIRGVLHLNRFVILNEFVFVLPEQLRRLYASLQVKKMNKLILSCVSGCFPPEWKYFTHVDYLEYTVQVNTAGVHSACSYKSNFAHTSDSCSFDVLCSLIGARQRSACSFSIAA